MLVKIFAEGVVGYGQIRPLAPHHSMPDTYATMISMIKDVCGPRLIGQHIFDVEGIHALFDSSRRPTTWRAPRSMSRSTMRWARPPTSRSTI